MSNKNNVTGYIDYFRQIAVSHHLLQHDPTSETGDCDPGAMHFSRISIEEILTALSSKAGFPFLGLELYDNDTSAENVFDIRQRPKGAFTIVDSPADKTFSAQEACFAKCEEIVYDILRKIYQDHYRPSTDECAMPFKEFAFGKLIITPVGPIFQNQFGYRVEFEFRLQNQIDITEAPEAGTFL